MSRLQYGQTIIEWRFKADSTLKRHYVTVKRGLPVLLRGPAVGIEEQEALVRQRARWIREKRALVEARMADEQIVTGSRLRYCGRTYFTEVRHAPKLVHATLRFTASRFVIENPAGRYISSAKVEPLLSSFFEERAREKLLRRVTYWEQHTGLQAADARIKNFKRRWANCTPQNILEFNPRLMELPQSVQDYVVIHELCHLVERAHNRAFWNLVARHMPDWLKRHQALEIAGIAQI
ncbi:M48 family metallopeptidase [uncultured Pseudacidovorax sp.]|uniref:M48 family metallopeptidase n=1 Tax=uncultured Pseudacidovorax sp. TaxID=679313 RepID=UPI0025E375C5|nr:SprT family zinc-dependent metalloprotease [uncultured Pseudacidovorax sp.]